MSANYELPNDNIAKVVVNASTFEKDVETTHELKEPNVASHDSFLPIMTWHDMVEEELERSPRSRLLPRNLNLGLNVRLCLTW